MANLHSTMRNGRGNTVSAASSDYAETMVETYQARIVTTLKKDGSYTVVVTDRETGVVVNATVDSYPQKETVASLPIPSFEDLQQDLEKHARDVLVDIETLQQWPLWNMQDVVSLTVSIENTLETMQDLASQFDERARRYIA